MMMSFRGFFLRAIGGVSKLFFVMALWCLPVYAAGPGGGGGGHGSVTMEVFYSDVTVQEYGLIDGIPVLRISDSSSPHVSHSCDPTTHAGTLYLRRETVGDEGVILMMLAYITKSRVDLLVDAGSSDLCNQDESIVNGSTAMYPNAAGYPGGGLEVRGFRLSGS